MQLIVVGMHRSGTSALGLLLEAMNCYFGPDTQVTPAQAANPKGYSERLDVVKLHEELLSNSSARWDAPGRFFLERLSPAVLREFDAQLSTILEDFNAHSPWFVKDPRLCLMLPLWKPRLKSAFYLVAYRHPLEVAASLHKRNALPMRFGIDLWERYMADALNYTRGERRFLVNYTQLLAQPSTVLEQFYKFLEQHGSAVPKRLKTDEIASILDKDLRHQQRSSQEGSYLLTSGQRRLVEQFENGTILQQDEFVDASGANSRLTDLASIGVDLCRENSTDSAGELKSDAALLGRIHEELWKNRKILEIAQKHLTESSTQLQDLLREVNRMQNVDERNSKLLVKLAKK